MKSGSKQVNVSAYILKQLTNCIPSKLLNVPTTPTNISLADPNFNVSKPVDMILGADVFEELMENQRREISPGLFLRKTIFGWVLIGKQNESTNSFISCHAFIDETLRKFWEVETLPQRKLPTEEELLCEKIFQETTRVVDNRFVVKLPFKKDAILGESLTQAQRRFSSLERRLDTNPELRKRYGDFVDEFVSLDHMEVVPENEINKPDSDVYYLPHHCVFKEDSTTTKLRVVFDGSAKTSNGLSLNESLMVGPVVQNDLFTILNQFRCKPIALSADIAKMYRQVELDAPDKDFHRLLWRSKKDEKVKHMRMKRVTYGIASSAFHSTRCLKEVANRTNNHTVADALNNSFYVDDFLCGANTITEARNLMKDLCTELSAFGFELRKWTSSHPELTMELPLEIRETSDELALFSEEYKIKALGICWKPNTDEFAFSIDLFPVEQLTKRTLLANSSKVFDPIGWIAPVIIAFKCLIQQTWVEGLSWDEKLPVHIANDWMELRTGLDKLNEFRIPRCVVPSQMHTKQLHVFCDASEKAYAAVVYLRTEDADQIIRVSLLTAKTRVSPVKQLSMPRLELCAAQLGATLLNTMRHILDIHDVFAWSDSTIVLNWLSKLPRTWNTFVANRVANIQEILPRNHWDHVPTEDNPADIASRGATASQLFENKLWWTGPNWLESNTTYWPHYRPTNEENQEKREPKSVLTLTITPHFMDVDRFSKLKTLVRVFAFIQRFINILKKDRSNFGTPLTATDLSNANFRMISFEQKRYFSEEFNLLKNQEELPKSSNMRNLTPFYDAEFDVLRVGGRMGNSNFNELKKFPLLIPKGSPLVPLIIRHFHEETLHGGGLLTNAAIREQYWIIGAKPQINKVIKNCVKCCRYSLKPPFQLMADLPAERVTQARPFSQCGLDFAGPVMTKLPDSACQKRYIALFVCFITKAIHLELVSNLTKEACILAVKRFSARRGTPTKLFSDNGSNFIGARNDLIKLQEILSSKEENSLFVYANQKGSQWITIPSRSPHFGGLWEAGVKSMKRHLRRIVGQQKLSNEELLTVLTLIEAILNSRPLTPLSNDPNDLAPLTPAHFLIGSSFNPVPTSNLQLPLNTRFRLIQQIQKDFWNAWKRDYLVTLQVRKKWFTNGPEINRDDLVLIADDDLKPLQWKTGRVVELYSGNDDITRVVKLKTSTGEMIRPVIKLRKLPIE